MTLMGWIKIKLLGVDQLLNTEIIEKIDHEKSKLNGAQVALSREVEAINAHRKRGAAIFEMLDDTLRAIDKERKR